jgi:DNA-directed RNA polymerase sigma subunit (sigma70/sigma32)
MKSGGLTVYQSWLTNVHWKKINKANLRFVVSDAKQYQNQELTLLV